MACNDKLGLAKLSRKLSQSLVFSNKIFSRNKANCSKLLHCFTLTGVPKLFQTRVSIKYFQASKDGAINPSFPRKNSSETETKSHLSNSTFEQTVVVFAHSLCWYTSASSRLPEYSNQIGVSTEWRNVILHPDKSLTLIPHPHITSTCRHRAIVDQGKNDRGMTITKPLKFVRCFENSVVSWQEIDWVLRFPTSMTFWAGSPEVLIQSLHANINSFMSGNSEKMYSSGKLYAVPSYALLNNRHHYLPNSSKSSPSNPSL